jgi:ankyrin repeat protein
MADKLFNDMLLTAASGGLLPLVHTALAAGADINARGEFNNTPLILAAQNGHVEIVRELLARKADIGAKGYCDFTALHLAARDGRIECVNLLLDHGAASSERLIDDVLTVASMSVAGKKAIVEMLQQARLKLVSPAEVAGDANAQLIAAAEKGDRAGVEAALNAGANVNARDGRGMDALNWASLRGHAAIVKTLIQKGAPVNEPNSVGWPPLGQAAGQGRLDAVRELLAGGANANIRFDSGKTALMCAAYGGFTEIARVLLEAGADPGARTDENDEGEGGQTARDLAQIRGNREIVELLDKR